MAHVQGIDRVKGRYVVALELSSFLVLPFVLEALLANWEPPWYWIELGFCYPSQLLALAFIGAAGVLVKVDFGALLGQWPTRQDWKLLLHADLILFASATALICALFLPTSYLLPDFVSWWLEWSYYPVVYLDDNGSLPLLANLLSLFSLAVLAPVTEEILFRGFLLYRWGAKWGMTRSIIASSALFGALHPDPLGAALFGAGMCLLYLHTRSLWVPIFAHAVYNGFLWFWELFSVLVHGFDAYLYDLDQFRSEWWVGAVGASVALVATVPFLLKAERDQPTRTIGQPVNEARAE